MDNREFECMLEKLLAEGRSSGSEAFREELLARCLAVLEPGAKSEAADLADTDLDLLAAAGDATAIDESSIRADNRLGC